MAPPHTRMYNAHTHRHTRSHMCACTQVQTYTHMHTHLYTHRKHTFTYTHSYLHMHMHSCTDIHTYAHTPTHTHTEACIHVLTHSYTHSGQSPWYLALHALVLRCGEMLQQSDMENGKLIIFLHQRVRGFGDRPQQGATCCHLGCESRSLSNKRWQFPQSKLIELNQTN